MIDRPLDIAVLYTHGCPATPDTIGRIRECVDESGIPAQVRKVLIESQEDADRSRFLGSPTVQVNGVDIDPSVRGIRVFGFM